MATPLLPVRGELWNASDGAALGRHDCFDHLVEQTDKRLARAELKRFPLSLNRRDSQRAANKILWPSRTEEACNGYSNDLRVRVIQVVEGDAAARAAARQFVIGNSTAIRWTKRWRETGSFEAKSNKGQSRSPFLRSRLLRHHASSTADERQCLPGLCRRAIR